MKDTASSKLITGCGKKLEHYDDGDTPNPSALFYHDGEVEYTEPLQAFGENITGGAPCGYIEGDEDATYYALCRDCCYKNGLIW